MEQKLGKPAAWLLTLAMIFTMLPTVSVPAAAAGTDTGKAIQLGTSGISGYDSTNGYDYIYYGTWDSSAIKWRVLDDQTNTGGSGLFLLSDVLLGTGSYGDVYFDNSGSDSNVWQNSSARAWCKDFAGEESAATNVTNAFTAGELGAVLATTKSDPAFTSGGIYGVLLSASENILNGDKVFFLSAEEAENAAYGFTNDTARVANYGASAGEWWLRSPIGTSGFDENYAGLVFGGGSVAIGIVTSPKTARPAFNLNLDSVLFTSATDNSGHNSSFAAPADYSGNEWKVTVKDDNAFLGGASFTGTTALMYGYSDTTLTINHAALSTLSADYTNVTAMLTDSNGNILYYGSINESTSATESTVTIPAGLAAGEYTLSVYGEDWNGEKLTDYATGTPYTIKITVHEHSWATDWSSDSTHHWHECGNSDCPVTDNSGMDGYAEHTPGENATYTDKGDGTHSFTCSVCGAVVTEDCRDSTYTVSSDGATCTVTCDHCKRIHGTVTIVAPACKTYGDGNSCEATFLLDGEPVEGNIPVNYYKGDTALDAAPTDAGTYRAEYVAFDDTYYDHKDVIIYVEYTIAPATITADMITVKEATYNGETQHPEETITYGGNTLVRNVDYSVQVWPDANYYRDAGEWEFFIHMDMNPNYTGETIRMVQTIHKATPAVTAPTAIENLIYTGEEQTLIPAGSVSGGEMQYSLDNATWSTELPQATNAGTYTVYYKVVGDSNHKDVDASSTLVTIFPASLADATVTLDKDTFTYDGQPHKPGVTVTLDGKELIVGTDYKVTYRIPSTMSGNNPTAWSDAEDTFTNAGIMYYAVVEGMGNYVTETDTTLYANFRIEPKVVTAPTFAELEESYLYQNGAEIKPTFKLMDGSTEIPASEYSVSYSNNTAVGTATITVMDKTGGNYTVSGSATFEIVVHVHDWKYTADGDTITATCEGNIGDCPDKEQSITLNASDAVYSGEMVQAEVTRDGTDLTYTLHYTSTDGYDSSDAPTNAGTYTVTMTVGEKSVSDTFTISPKDIANCTADLSEDSFTYSGEAPTLTVTVVDNGVGSTSLVKDTDYTVGTVAVNAGSHKLTVTGTGNYTGTVELDYTITAKAITPTVEGVNASYTYTGKSIQPTVTVKDGNTALAAGTDYDVTYGSNINVADGGSVTVTLKGNYSGSKTADFAISKVTLTVTADNKTMTTGHDLPDLTYTITGFVNGETEEVLTTKPTAETSTNGGTAGTYDITVSGAEAANYDFTYVKGTLSVVDHEHDWSFNASGETITATCANADGCPNATQSIKLIAPASLVYDGSEKVVTVEGTIDGMSIEVVYSGDRRNVTADGFSASVTLGNAKAEISGLKITPAPVTITGLTATDRTYNGTVNVTLTGGALNGVVLNDDVTIALTGASIVMADKNVGTNKPVSISGITLGGTAAGNYELSKQPTGVTVNITAAPLTIKSATIADVLYREDGNYTLMVTGVEFNGLVNGENLTLDTDYTATAQLTGANTADTAADATVTVTLSNSNYSLVPNTCSAKVNLFTHKHDWSFSVNGDTLNAKCSNVDGSCPVPRAMATIQLVAPTVENLVYNGQPKTVTVAQTPDGTFSDLPVVSYCCTDGCINAGEHTAKLTYRGVTAEKKFTIAQKDITGATIGAFAEMTYNGAAQTPSATVTINGLTVTGTWSGVTNVSDKTTFTASGNFTGTIADQTTGMKKAAPTAADFTFAPPANPVNDGSEKAASVTTDKSGMGVISIIYYRNGGDAPVTPADAGEYLVAINVTEGENYLAASSLRAESWKFTITQTQTAMTAQTDDTTYVYGEVITVTGMADVPQPEQQGFNLLRAFTGPKAQQVALYDASGNQLTDGVDVVNGAYTITYDTKLKGIDPGQGLTLTVQFVGDANMSNRSVATNKFTLNAKSISPVVSGTVTKAYDGTTAVPANHNLTIGLTDKIDGDTVNASGSFAYADAIVGTGKAINATGIILSGTDAKFYMLSTDSVSSAVGEITKAKLNGVTAPADQTLNVYCMNATAAIAQLPTTVTYSVEGGGTIALNISWSCDSYNNTPNAENTFTWSVNDVEKLACYAPNTGVATSGSINVKNSAAIPVTLTGTPVTITYSGTTYDVSAMFTIGQGAGTPSYEIVTGGTGEGTLNGSALTITKAGTFTVKLTTAANGAYAASTATAVLTVEKGIPTVTTPTGLAAYYSQTLSQITLPADANGTWSWADGNTLVGEVGQRVHKAIFTPKDTNLWHAIYVDVTINVVQAGTVFVGDVGVYNGETATKAFTYGDTITVKVNPAAAQPATFSLRSLLAPQKDQMALYIRANGTDTQITNPVTADKNGIFTMEYVTTGKALVIGNNKLVAKYVGNDNMAAQEQEIEVTLAQKELSFVSITAQSRAYEQGNNQVFVTGAELNGVESGDSVTLDTAGLTASVSSDAVNTYYSAMLPAGISLTGNDAEYYFITGSVSVTVAQGGVEITEKQPAALTFELSQTSFVYNRNEQKPTVTIKDGEIVLTAGVDYDITWPENCIDVGEKAILITFKGNYSGETTLTYEIVAQIPTIIVKQPTDQFVVEGQRAEFSIEATGAGLTYLWYINRNDGRGWRDIEGAIGAVYITSVTDLECDGFQYGCLITDQYGNTLKSDVAVLHVSKVPVLPETGDSSTPMLWLAMSILSMAGILLLRKKAFCR